MEVCTARVGGAISSLPHHRLFHPNQALLPWKTSLPRTPTSFHRTNLGLQYHINTPIKATTSEETSTESSQYVKDETSGVLTMDKNESGGSEGSGDESSEGDEMQPFQEFLEKLNIEFNSESPYSSLLLFGGGSLVALWLATAVVGSIDSVPVFPKVMQVVGLGYSLWFTTRYLLFKKNRDELAAKIEEIKQKVLGSDDD